MYNKADRFFLCLVNDQFSENSLKNSKKYNHGINNTILRFMAYISSKNVDNLNLCNLLNKINGFWSS